MNYIFWSQEHLGLSPVQTGSAGGLSLLEKSSDNDGWTLGTPAFLPSTEKPKRVCNQSLMSPQLSTAIT